MRDVDNHLLIDPAASYFMLPSSAAIAQIVDTGMSYLVDRISFTGLAILYDKTHIQRVLVSHETMLSEGAKLSRGDVRTDTCQPHNGSCYVTL